MSGKENVDVEAAASVSLASPRLSASAASAEEAPPRPAPGPAYVPTGTFAAHDDLHWGGVGQRSLAHDARSVASSAAADRDDKSIYEEPGALDATEGALGQAPRPRRVPARARPDRAPAAPYRGG